MEDIKVTTIAYYGATAVIGFLVFMVVKNYFLDSPKRTSDHVENVIKPETVPTVFLKDKKRRNVKLLQKIELSHDTRLFRFDLPNSGSLGLPVGKHIKVFAPNVNGVAEGKWNGRDDPEHGKEEIERKYTPTASEPGSGFFDLVIKVYKKGGLEQFPDGGKMSQYMDSLRIGDKIQISGPYGIHEYLGEGWFQTGKRKEEYHRVGMIAGGTGITPMLQIISAVLNDDDDLTELYLLYANKSESDILVRDMLEALRERYPDKFHLHYTLDKAPAKGWKYSEGFVDADMISQHLPPPDEKTLIMLCGPPPMIKFACKPALEKIGYAKSSIKEC